MPLCIVVPTYNNTQNERYLDNIESILQQEYENYRVLVIDDASPDNTEQFIHKYLIERDVPEEKVLLMAN